MKKKFELNKTIILTGVVSFLFCCLFLLSACDLSHKHYTDNFWVCRSCGEDTVEILKVNANYEFTSSESYGRANEYVYFKFVSLGEDLIDITVEEVSARVSYVELYTKTSSNLYLKHMSGENVYSHESPLTQGETYYIRVKLYNAGKIKVRVSPVIEN